MAEVAYPKLAYTPVVAKRLGRNAESIEIACKYLARTGDSSLRAEIASLGLQSQSNLRAAYNLLDDTNEGKVVANTILHAKNLYKAQRAKSGQTTTESAIQIEKLLRPGPEHATDSEVASCQRTRSPAAFRASSGATSEIFKPSSDSEKESDHHCRMRCLREEDPRWSTKSRTAVRRLQKTGTGAYIGSSAGISTDGRDGSPDCRHGSANGRHGCADSSLQSSEPHRADRSRRRQSRFPESRLCSEAREVSLIKSTQVECDKNKIERLEESVGNMSDFIVDQEVEKRGFKAMLEAEGGESVRRDSRFEEVIKENTQLKVRIKQLEQQAEKGIQLS